MLLTTIDEKLLTVRTGAKFDFFGHTDVSCSFMSRYLLRSNVDANACRAHPMPHHASAIGLDTFLAFVGPTDVLGVLA